MKKLGLGLIAFLLGQAVMLYKKDTILQKKLEKTPNMLEKLKIIGLNLFGFNKNLFEQVKDDLSHIDRKKREALFVEKKKEIFVMLASMKKALQSGDDQLIKQITQEGKEYLHTLEIFLQTSKESLHHHYDAFLEKHELLASMNELIKSLKPSLQSNPKKISSPASSKKSL